MPTIKLVYTESYFENKLEFFMIRHSGEEKSMGYVTNKTKTDSLDEKIEELIRLFLAPIKDNLRAQSMFCNSQVIIVYKNTTTNTEIPYKLTNNELLKEFKNNKMRLA